MRGWEEMVMFFLPTYFLLQLVLCIAYCRQNHQIFTHVCSSTAIAKGQMHVSIAGSTIPDLQTWSASAPSAAVSLLSSEHFPVDGDRLLKSVSSIMHILFPIRYHPREHGHKQ